MAKALEDMTLEELWELFPIALVEHKDSWAEQYREMEQCLYGVLADFSDVRISHIGSTAIAGIKAKDIVDVLVELGGEEGTCPDAPREAEATGGAEDDAIVVVGGAEELPPSEAGATVLERAARLLEDVGFIRMSSEPRRISLNYGYTSEGFADKVYHVHLRYRGDNDEICFRDYLNAHPDAAAEYEKLKVALQKQFEHDRDAYTAGKGEFVDRCVAKARTERGILGTA